MSFRLGSIFYVFALLAAALATFGLAGIFAAALVLGFWGWLYYVPKRFDLLNLTLAIIAVGVLFSLMLPSVQSAREAARRNVCSNNLKHIILGLLNYENATGSFPPPYLADANGQPMHSWRVLILPFMEELALYQRYNRNEPWDGPNNSTLAGQIPDVYRCPSQADDDPLNPYETQYFAVVGPETGWPEGGGRTFRQFPDGTAKTIMVIEATGLGIHWMEPRDPTLDEAVELLTTRPRSGHRHVHDGFLTTTYYETSFRNVVFCDGHTLWMGQLDDAQIAKALLTAEGGEPVVAGSWKRHYVEPEVTTVIKWGKVWGLGVFVLLSLLPAGRLYRRQPATAGEANVENVPGAA